MSEINAARKPVCCRDCGQPLGIIRQDGLDGDYLVQVTCWQTDCLLHGFTLSLNQYLSLTESELEIYRKTTRAYPLKLVCAAG